MIKGSIHQEEITIINIYSPYIRTIKYRKQTLTELKGEIEKNTIIVGDFNTPLSIMYRTFIQKINKETENNTIYLMNLTDI